jgi:hypothetical protein
LPKTTHFLLCGAFLALMKPFVWIAILLLIGIVACGCTGLPPAVPAPEDQTGIPATTVTPGITARIAGSGTSLLSDRQPDMTLPLDPGVIVVSFQTRGAQHMLITFGTTPPGGYGAANDFTTTGPYNGSVAFQVPKKGEYALNISSTGEWTAEVSPLTVKDPLQVPVNLSGAGTVVTPVFYLERGQYLFERNQTMLTSPLFFIQHVNGSPLMDPNNTYVQPGFSGMSPEPFRFITIPESGYYFMCVLSGKSPDNWSASIVSLPAISPRGPGPVINWSIGNGTSDKT